MGFLQRLFRKKDATTTQEHSKIPDKPSAAEPPSLNNLVDVNTSQQRTDGNGVVAQGLQAAPAVASFARGARASSSAAPQPPMDIHCVVLERVDYTHDASHEVHAFCGDDVHGTPDDVPFVVATEGAEVHGDIEPLDPHTEEDSVVEGEDQQTDGHPSEALDDDQEEGPVPTVDPLASMVYLSEDKEGVADTISVMSDERTEAELAEELTELSRAVEAMENSIADPSSPVLRGGDGNGTILGTSPVGSFSTMGGSTTTDFYSKNMVNLYNDLALRLMDAREYDQALGMLRKAEALLDNDAAWFPGDGEDTSVKGGEFEIAAKATSEAGLQLLRVGSNVESANGSEKHESRASSSSVSRVERLAAKRARLRSITYNNIGCLYKRRGVPLAALSYLQNALALEVASGDVHNCSSTHLNLCAAYSALHRYSEALGHAERAIILLQRQLWPAALSFHDGVLHLGRTVQALSSSAVTLGQGTNRSKTAEEQAAAQRRHRQILASVNILAMAYHNAAVEHERLGRGREAHVSYHRACSLSQRFLGPKSSTTLALNKAQRAFAAKQQRAMNAGGSGGPAAAGSSHVASGTGRKVPSASTSMYRAGAGQSGKGPGLPTGSKRSTFLKNGTAMALATWTARDKNKTLLGRQKDSRK